MALKAPFNFIPLEDTVYIPEWGGKVSQDIPFSDGKNGTIELNIISETPIFVRNGCPKDDEIEKTFFSRINEEKYFIPGTTIKGAIRNVMEIMTFAKFTQVENDSFGLRNPNDKVYRNKMKKVHCGWLQWTDDKYTLTDCGEPGRISLSAIDSEFNTSFDVFAKDENNFKNDAGRTAKAKYEKLNKGTKLKGVFEIDAALSAAMKKNNPVDNRKFMKFGGKQRGTLVFTGQPGVRKFDKFKKRWDGKYYEFIFLENETSETILLKEDANVIRAFKTIHKNSPDFAEFWSIELKQGKQIPVFFQYENKEIHSIGLSYMYKYPYNSSVFDGIDNKFKNPEDKTKMPELDMPELIFGHVYVNSLRGRVQVGHAFAKGKIKKYGDVGIKIALSSPHSSYYPLYIGSGNSWNTPKGEFQIAGRKRYPVRNAIESNEATDNMTNIINPLDRGNTFEGKIHFHNLKEVELGALLSALTFQEEKDCFHNLGAGKPLGYGKVKIEAKLTGDHSGKESHYMTIFRSHMEENCDKNWFNSDSINELFSLARGIPKGKESLFTYLKMSNNPNNNEFKIEKKDYDNGKITFDFFSEIVKKSIVNNTSKIKTFLERNESVSGWELNVNEEYMGKIDDNGICVYDNNEKRQKNIICKEYNITSPIEKPCHNHRIKFKIIIKNRNSIEINILDIY